MLSLRRPETQHGQLRTGARQLSGTNDYKPRSAGKMKKLNVTMLNSNPLMLEGPLKKFNPFMLWLVEPVGFRRNV